MSIIFFEANTFYFVMNSEGPSLFDGPHLPESASGVIQLEESEA